MKKLLALIIVLFVLTGCMGRIAKLEGAGDINVDTDANNAVDTEYGGTNATSASAALTSLGAASSTALSNHTNNTSNPHVTT